MERESFVFYRSFYEAIKCMPPEVQAEIYPAIMEYALLGKQPKNLSEIARGIFLLIQPNIDANNKRFENGRKGGQYGKLGGRPKRPKADSKEPYVPKPSDRPKPPAEPYTKTFAEEVAQMRTETIWLESVCMEFSIGKDEVQTRLDTFLEHLNRECSDKPHRSHGDALRHFCSWMRRKYPAAPIPNDDEQLPPPDYTFNGGFGGMDT